MSDELIEKEKLYTKQEVKAKKTVSGITGFVLGAFGTVLAGVVLNKAAKVNIIDSATKALDAGAGKVKKVAGRSKGKEPESRDESGLESEE
jgi:hypothetical protein